mgnify:CR=1 FL=1
MTPNPYQGLKLFIDISSGLGSRFSSRNDTKSLSGIETRRKRGKECKWIPVAMTPNPYQGLKLHPAFLVILTSNYRRNDTKSLSGIETSDSLAKQQRDEKLSQ